MQTDRLMTWKELRTLVPYSRMHIWRLERENRFPRRRQVGPNRVAWLASEVHAWIASLPRTAEAA